MSEGQADDNKPDVKLWEGIGIPGQVQVRGFPWPMGSPSKLSLCGGCRWPFPGGKYVCLGVEVESQREKTAVKGTESVQATKTDQ